MLTPGWHVSGGPILMPPKLWLIKSPDKPKLRPEKNMLKTRKSPGFGGFPGGWKSLDMGVPSLSSWIWCSFYDLGASRWLRVSGFRVHGFHIHWFVFLGCGLPRVQGSLCLIVAMRCVHTGVWALWSRVFMVQFLGFGIRVKGVNISLGIRD